MYTLFLHLNWEVSSSLRREGEKEREEGRGRGRRGRGGGRGRGRGRGKGEYQGGASRERGRNFIPSTAHLSSITGARHVAFRIGNLSL